MVRLNTRTTKTKLQWNCCIINFPSLHLASRECCVVLWLASHCFAQKRRKIIKKEYSLCIGLKGREWEVKPCNTGKKQIHFSLTWNTWNFVSRVQCAQYYSSVCVCVAHNLTHIKQSVYDWMKEKFLHTCTCPVLFNVSCIEHTFFITRHTKKSY